MIDVNEIVIYNNNYINVKTNNDLEVSNIEAVERRNWQVSDPTQDEHHLAWGDSKRIQYQQQRHQRKNMPNPKAHLAAFANNQILL